MNIQQEHQLICIQLLANANFGSASGRVTLDRPTQVDAYFGLPFIPNSSLRGVMHALCELDNHPLLKSAFGLSDTNEEGDRIPNVPGNLVIGNGDLLAFPVLAENGERFWVFPVQNIYKFLALEELFASTVKLARLAKLIYTPSSEDQTNALGIPAIPFLNTPFTIKQIPTTQNREEIAQLLMVLRKWCTGWIPEDDPLLIVSHQTASYLWDKAADIRDATALNPKKTAQSQSLRRIETIPEGTIFLSLVTYLDDKPLTFTDRPIQVGSSEGKGLGFCRLAVIEEGDVEHPFPAIAATSAEEMPTNAEIMMTIYSAIDELTTNENSDESLRKKVRTAIGDFGWRMQTEGLEAALAFALAKAKPHSAKRTTENNAYKWFLQTLLSTNGELKPAPGEQWFAETFTEAEKIAIRQRWLWLRKYAEIRLR